MGVGLLEDLSSQPPWLLISGLRLLNSVSSAGEKSRKEDSQRQTQVLQKFCPSPLGGGDSTTAVTHFGVASELHLASSAFRLWLLLGLSL